MRLASGAARREVAHVLHLCASKLQGSGFLIADNESRGDRSAGGLLVTAIIFTL